MACLRACAVRVQVHVRSGACLYSDGVRRSRAHAVSHRLAGWHGRRYICTRSDQHWWLGSRVVSVLNSRAEGPRFKSQPRRCRVTVHTHRASVHQAAKLVAALLRVARVTAGLAESNGSLPPCLWLTSPAGWLPRTGISSWTLRSVIEYGLPFRPTFIFSRNLTFTLCLQVELSS